jgi:hypothetical protein
MTSFAEHYISGQIAAAKEKENWELFGWHSSAELNTKIVDNSSIFPSVTHTVLSDFRFRCYRILSIDETAEICPGRNSSFIETKFWRLG